MSCPNVEDRSRMFAHSAEATARVLAATACGLPRWAKLSPNVPDIVEIATGARAGRRRRPDPGEHPARAGPRHRDGPPRAGAGGGGLSGAAVHPVAVRAVWECRCRLSRPSARRRGRGLLRPRRGRAVAGRRRRRAGGNGHVPRSPGAVEGAAPGGAVVRRPADDGGRAAVVRPRRGPRCAGTGEPRSRSRPRRKTTSYWRTEDAMGDGFLDRVTAAVGPMARCAPASTPPPACWPTGD